MTPGRRIRPFGDRAVVIDVDTIDDALALSAAIDGGDAPAGTEEVILGYRSVTVVADPTVTDMATWTESLAAVTRTGVSPASVAAVAGKLVEIPVAFTGSDLDDVARLARMTPGRVVELLTGAELGVAFIGFAPGFAYLVGLDPALAAVPRRPRPRPSVPGGSLALAGGFAAIYPQSSPGGWHLLGRTEMRLFDPLRPPYSLLRAGDRVRLRAAEIADETAAPSGPGRRQSLPPDAGRCVRVEDAGLFSLVQDQGRRGAARLGVPRAGAADPDSFRIANRLVGNADSAAAIEVTGRGPTLRFSAAAHVAVVGPVEVTVDGRSVPSATVVPVDAGHTVSVGVVRQGLRAYIAVAGGIAIPAVLGSRSSDVLSRLGFGPLVPGDTLPIGPPSRPRGRAELSERSDGPAVLRVTLGPDPFPDATVERLLSTTWVVDTASDRIGVRLQADAALTGAALSGAALSGAALSGAALTGAALTGAALTVDSRGMVTGAIQLPPDGQPIALLCDHPTVGGYPVIATVVSADLGLLGQLAPGHEVRLEAIDLDEARRARTERERFIADAVTGWYPVRTD
jgi:KipI family sensor histidine kinase inhibitor